MTNTEATPSPIPNDSPNPYLFVGGCPRSGTTLLQRMLDSHPQLAVANDTHFIPRALKKYDPAQYAAAADGTKVPLNEQLIEHVWNYHRFYRLGLSRNQFLAVANDCDSYQSFVSRLFDRLAASKDKSYAGEKTPDYVRHMPLLSGMFPESRFIEIVRDGRDVALSLIHWSTPGKGPGRLAHWDTDPVAVTALWWQQFTRDAIDFCSKKSSPGWLRTIRYEDLLESPDRILNDLCEFLTLPMAPAMLKFHKGRQHSAPNASAKSQWLPPTKGLRNWRIQMAEEDVAVFQAIAGAELTFHGYDIVASPSCPRVDARVAAAKNWWNSGGRLRRKKPDSTQHVSGQLDATQRVSEEHSNSTATLATNDAPLISRDTEIPSLGLVLSDDQLRHYLKTQISADEDSSIENLCGTYVRYKPGTSCLVRLDAGDGNCWGFAVAFSVDSTEKLEKAQRHFQSPNKDFGFVDFARMIVVYRYPFDPALPTLQQVVGGHLPTELQSTTNNSELSVQLLSYKPLRRCVLKVTDASDSSNPRVIRLYTETDFEQASERAKHMASSRWSMGGRLADSRRHNLVVLNWMEAESLADLHGDVLRQHTRRAGQRLADLHAEPNPKFEVRTRAQLIENAAASAQGIVALLPKLKDNLDKLIERIQSAVHRVTPRMVGSHGDFHLGQLLSAADEIQVLDWDHGANAPPAVDLACFISHLLLESVARDDLETTEPVIAEFLKGYEEQAALPVNLDAYIAMQLVSIASQLFRNRIPDWPTKTATLVAIARDRIATSESPMTRVPSAPPAMRRHESSSSLPTMPSEGWLEAALSPGLAEPKLISSLGLESGEKLVATQLLHVKPGRRALIGYRLQAPTVTAESQIVLAKARKKGVDLHSFNTQKQLYERLAAESDNPLQVARPLGIIPEWNMWLQSRVEGERVESLLTPEADTETSLRVGVALAELHNLQVATPRVHSFDDEFKILEQRLTTVAEGHKRWHDRLKSILGLCREILRVNQSATKNIQTGIHRDFHPGQVLVHTSHVGIVDFDLFASGHPGIDVANYVAHLQELAIRIHSCHTALNDHQCAFLEGYQSTSRFALSFDLIRDLSLVSLARHVSISRRIRTRRPFTEAILEACETLASPHHSSVQT